MVLLGYSTEQMMDRANVSRDVIRSRIARIFTAFNLNSRHGPRCSVFIIIWTLITKRNLCYGM